MARVYSCKSYLESFLIASGRQRSKIITNASDEEIKCLFEIVLNSVNLKLDKSEEKEFKKCQTLIKSFFRTKWNLFKFRSFVSKHSLKFQILTAWVFNKFMQEEICKVINNGVQPPSSKGNSYRTL